MVFEPGLGVIKQPAAPVVDASDRKFYIRAAERGNDQSLKTFDASLAAQREKTLPRQTTTPPPPAPTPTATPAAAPTATSAGTERPVESLADRQRGIDAIATASPYAAQVMRTELRADVDETQGRFVDLARDERSLGTSGGYVTEALRAERNELGAELSDYYRLTNTGTSAGSGDDGVSPDGAGESSEMAGDQPADDRTANDHTYVISTRSFAPHESFGAGFQGDNRGFSTDPDVTSRIHSTITLDTTNPNTIHDPDIVSAESDPSVYHVTPFLRPEETPSVDLFGAQYGSQDGSDRSTIDVSTKHSGKDAYGEYLGFGIGNPAPAIDVHTNLNIVDDRHDQTLTITGELTGDNFPATEAFITDPSGQSVFLATGGPPAIATPFINLMGDRQRPITDISVTFNTDENGNFVSVADGDRTYSLDEWNEQFTAEQPDFTEPPIIAGLNSSTLELRESYGEVGGAVSGGWNEIREADGAAATSVEVLEAGGDVVGEVLEAGVSVPAAQILGDAESVVEIADLAIPGDGIPFVDLNLPDKPGWWPGG